MRDEIEKYVRSLGLDAYLVGGAVRDELLGLESKDADFLVPGLDTEGLRAALEPYGRVDDLVVADRLVKTTVFLQRLDDFQAMNGIYAKHVGEQPPARATVEVAKLPSGALVEIEAVAVL